MNFNELALSRRSIRSYIQKDVPDELINELLISAQAAPSGGNCQPWHFYVVKNKDMILEIHERSCRQSFISDVPVLIVVCADIPRSEARYGDRGKNLYCIQDTAAAIQNILLCAESLSLGTCWCGAFNEAELSNILSLDANMRPVAIIPVGYPESKREMPKRRPIDEIATYIK